MSSVVVRTRFAPSPTGHLHIGGARTALFCWAYARRMSGEFVLRIEDTDRERSTREALDAILAGLAWLGLDPDAGPFYQSARTQRYRAVIDELLAQGKAYYCYATREELETLRNEQLARKEKPRYDGRYRDYQGPPRAGVPPVVRFKSPLDGEVVVDDQVRGRVVFDNRELDDLIIARADGTPTYHLCVVVDDLDMEITHVIRGDDHLNNTPRQIHISRALGAQPPTYAHVPMILGADGKRLSKRHAAVSVLEYQDRGYLPEALVSYLARLGWAHGDQEIFSSAEIARLFDIAGINQSAATFDPDKLTWVNEHYIQSLPEERLLAPLRAQMERQGVPIEQGPPPLSELLAVQRTRAKTLAEMASISRVFYEDFEVFDDKAARKHLRGSADATLAALAERLRALPAWTAEHIHAVVAQVAERLALKFGQVAQPLRVAAVGQAASPPIDATLYLLGPERTLARIERAQRHIRDAQQPQDAR